MKIEGFCGLTESSLSSFERVGAQQRRTEDEEQEPGLHRRSHLEPEASSSTVRLVKCLRGDYEPIGQLSYRDQFVFALSPSHHLLSVTFYTFSLHLN